MLNSPVLSGRSASARLQKEAETGMLPRSSFAHIGTQPPSSISKRARFLPLNIGLVWSISTILLFEFGPYYYWVNNKLLLYAFLFFAHLALILGYRSGIRSKPRNYRGKHTPGQLINLCLLVSVVWTIQGLLRGGLPSLESALMALEDPFAARGTGGLRSPGLMSYLAIFVDPLIYAFISWVVFYWSSTTTFARVWFALNALLTVYGSVVRGTRHGLLAYMMFVGLPFAAAYYSKRIRLKGLKKVLLALLIIVILYWFVLYVGHIVLYRTHTPILDYDQRLAVAGNFNFDHILYRVVPPSARPAVFGMISYFTHGYEALARCLEKSILGTTLGFGHSRFLTRNLVRLTGYSNFYRLSYFFRLNIEDGYLLSRWITAYPWFASDVTFVGVIGLMFLLGKLLASSWLDALVGHNPFAILALTWLGYQVFSLPQGSVTQDGQGLVAFAGAIVLWLSTREKNGRVRGTHHPVL